MIDRDRREKRERENKREARETGQERGIPPKKLLYQIPNTARMTGRFFSIEEKEKKMLTKL